MVSSNKHISKRKEDITIMKKFHILLTIFAVAVAVAFLSCASAKDYGDIVQGKTYRVGEWLDDDAYAITTVGLLGLQRESKGGVCPDDLNGEDLYACLEKGAQEAARLEAEYKILLKFTGGKFRGAAGMKNFRLSGIAAAEEVEGTIRNGSVEEIKCDRVRCAVTYVIYSKGLKQKVKNLQNALR